MLVEKKILSDHFEEIYVSWFSRMKYFALEYVVSEEDAENIVQDVFTELWERKEILAYDVNLVALLFTSIKNRCIDLLRHRIVVKEAVNLILPIVCMCVSIDGRRSRCTKCRDQT